MAPRLVTLSAPDSDLNSFSGAAAVMTFFVLLLVATLFVMFLVIQNWSTPIVRAASPLFLILEVIIFNIPH